MQGYGHGGVLAGLDGLAVRVEQRARALGGRGGLPGRHRGEDFTTIRCCGGRPLRRRLALELRSGVIGQELRRLLLLLGVLQDVVHGARQLARHLHEGRALLLKELEPIDDFLVRLGAPRLAHCGHHRWNLQR